MIVSVVLGACNREEARSLAGPEAGHLELRDDEAALVDHVDDLAGVHVHIGLDQRKRRFLALCELLTGICVTVVNQLELTRVDGDDGANI